MRADENGRYRKLNLVTGRKLTGDSPTAGETQRNSDGKEEALTTCMAVVKKLAEREQTKVC